jgi:hypothetical protein
MAMRIARIDSSRVAGNRWRKMSIAESPGCTPVETPKSPDAARVRNFQYCTKMGWSRPSSRVSAARLSVVARSPRRAETGPPGSERSHANSSTDSTPTTITSCSNRRTV